MMFLLSIENFFMGLNHVWSLLEMQSFQIKVDELHVNVSAILGKEVQQSNKSLQILQPLPGFS